MALDTANQLFDGDGCLTSEARIGGPTQPECHHALADRKRSISRTRCAVGVGEFWSTELMRTQPGLPKGWSFPIESSDVEEYFPGVGYTNWVPSTAGLKDWVPRHPPCLSVAREPRTAVPRYVLTVRAGPSEHRAGIRKWIDEEVGLEARAWMQALESQSPAWLNHGHGMHWFWHPESDSD